MTLRCKTLLIISIILCSSVVGIYLSLSKIMLKGFSTLDNYRAMKNAMRLEEAVNQDLDQLKAFAVDYGAWDATYEYIVTRYDYWERENAELPTFENLGISNLILVDANKKIILNKSYDLKTGKEIFIRESKIYSFLENNPLVEHKNERDAKSGIIILPEGVLLAASSPIVTSVKNGPIRGTLIFGRWLDKEKRKEISIRAQFPTNFYPYFNHTAPKDVNEANLKLSNEMPYVIQTLSESVIAGYVLFKDIYGHPALIGRIKLDRGGYEQGLRSLRMLAFALITISLIAGTAVILTLEKMVLSRIGKLNRDVIKISENADDVQRVRVIGNDELATLAVCINNMLESLELSKAELEANEIRLRTIFNSVQTGVLAVDAETGFITLANPAAAEMIGLPADEIIGKEFRHFIRSSKNPEQAAGVALGEVHSAEFVLHCSDGQKRNVVKTVIPIQLNGRRHFLENFTDITERKKMEEAIRDQKEWFRTTLNSIGDAVIATDKFGKVNFINKVAELMTGWRSDAAIGRHIQEVLDIRNEKTGNPVENPLQKALKAGTIVGLANHTILISRDGKRIPIDDSAAPIKGEDGVIRGAVMVFRDISERKKAESLLRMQTSAINAAGDQIVITDSEGKIIFVNPAFERETGYTASEVKGQPLDFLGGGLDNESIYCEMWRTVRSGKAWNGELTNRRKNGTIYTEDVTMTPVKDDDGNIRHFISIKRNVTEKKAIQNQLDHLAHHDPLTGLPNRLLFGEKLSEKLKYSRKNDKQLAVMFLDLDRFKFVNDSLGHDAGDELLIEVSKRIRKAVRETDIVARMGGDEFTFILSSIQSKNDAAVVAKKILDAFSEPFYLKGQELFCGGSIGISIYPSDGEDVQTLIRNADSAMYKAKEENNSSFCFAGDLLSPTTIERITIEAGLRRAIEKDDFIIHYQPQVDLKTGEFSGTEALVRWQRAEQGLVMPDQFIPIAEETGLIAQIGELVLRKACAQNAAWQQAGYTPMEVAVNISAQQIENKTIISTVQAALKETGLDAQYLHLEVTESTIIRNLDAALESLQELKDMGVKISVDDFGTGQTALSQIKRLPLDAVKIDKSFIKELGVDQDDTTIVRAVIAMAHSLNLKVMAEGVETLQQLQLLREMECDQIQGYFISRPMTAEEHTRMLEESGCRIDSIVAMEFQEAA